MWPLRSCCSSLCLQGTERYGALGRTDIEVTGEQMAGGLQLQVRRGSEPALNQLPEGLGSAAPLPPPCQRKAASKRWSAAPIILESSEPAGATPPKAPKAANGLSPGSNDSLDWDDDHHRDGQQPQQQPQREAYLRPPAYGRFNRDGSNRLSMQFLGESAS